MNFYHRVILISFLLLSQSSQGVVVQLFPSTSKMVYYSTSYCTHSFNDTNPNNSVMVPNNSAAEITAYKTYPPTGVLAQDCTPMVYLWQDCAVHPDPTCKSVARGAPAGCLGGEGPGVWGCQINTGNAATYACGAWSDGTACTWYDSGAWSSVPNGDWFSIANYEGWMVSGNLIYILSGLGCGTLYVNSRHSYTTNLGTQKTVTGCW